MCVCVCVCVFVCVGVCVYLVGMIVIKKKVWNTVFKDKTKQNNKTEKSIEAQSDVNVPALYRIYLQSNRFIQRFKCTLTI